MLKWFFILPLLICSFFVHVQDDMQNKITQKDSLQYTRLKQRFYKTKLGKETYNLLFKDVYNRNKSHVEEVKFEVNPFLEYQGKRIRFIKIQQMDALGASVYDTTRTGKKFERFISCLLYTSRCV